MNISEIPNKVVYGDDPEVIFHPARKNVDKFIVQGILATAFAGMAGGVFLTGYLIWLGASDALLSYLPILGGVCGVMLVMFASWVNRREHRRALMITMALFSKVCIIGTVFVPLIFPESGAAYVAFFMLVIGNILSAICGMIFNTWFVELVPAGIRGRCFSARQIFCVVTTMIVPVVAGRFLDSVADRYVGFFCVFMAAVAVGAFELVVYSRIDDVTISTERKKTGFLTVIKTPLSNRPFMGYTMLMFFHHLFVFIGASFNQIFMLKYLMLSYTYVNTVSIISSALQIFILLKFWGRVADRVGSQFVMVVSMFLLVGELILWSTLRSDNAMYIFPFLYVFSAVGNSGLSVGGFSRRYDVIPAQSRVVYDSFYSCVFGISLLISPMIGNFVRSMFANMGFNERMENGGIRMAYVLTVVLMILLYCVNIVVVRARDRSNPLFKWETYKITGGIFLRSFIRK